VPTIGNTLIAYAAKPNAIALDGAPGRSATGRWLANVYVRRQSLKTTVIKL
jgi:hypothetical protein